VEVLEISWDRVASWLPWVTLALGLVLIIAVWIAVPTLGNGTPKPWLWDTGSWQAVTTGLTGYALAVFASLQVAGIRHTWKAEQNRLIEQRRQDILIALTEADVAVGTMQNALTTALARRQLEHPEMSGADINAVLESVNAIREDIYKEQDRLTDQLSLPQLEAQYGRAVQARLQIAFLGTQTQQWADNR